MSLLTENGHVLDVLLFQLVSTRGDSYACLFSDNPNDDPDPSKMNHVMKFYVLCKYNNIVEANLNKRTILFSYVRSIPFL